MIIKETKFKENECVECTMFSSPYTYKFFKTYKIGGKEIGFIFEGVARSSAYFDKKEFEKLKKSSKKVQNCYKDFYSKHFSYSLAVDNYEEEKKDYFDNFKREIQIGVNDYLNKL